MIAVDQFFKDGTLENDTLVRVNTFLSCLPHRRLVSDAYVTNALADQDLLALEEVLIFEVFEAVQDQVAEIGDAHSHDQLLSDLEATECLTSIENLKLGEVPVKFGANRNHEEALVVVDLGSVNLSLVRIILNLLIVLLKWWL